MAFADAQARAGAAVSRHLVNACLSVGGCAVPGLLDDDPMDAGLGTLGMQTRRRSFGCSTTALDAAQYGLAVDDAVELGDESMRVTARLDDAATGRTTLVLTKA